MRTIVGCAILAGLGTLASVTACSSSSGSETSSPATTGSEAGASTDAGASSEGGPASDSGRAVPPPGTDAGPSPVPDAGLPNGSALPDFQQRCAQPGVILCQGFDDASLFSAATWPASGLYPDGNANFGGTQSTATARSGSGALMFTVPSNAGANSAGYWRQLFTSSLSAAPADAKMFGASSTFYVQYAQRFSPEYLSNQWPVIGGGTTFWKQQIISNDNSTCGSVELTTVNGYNRGYPIMYSQCGADGFQVPLPGGDDYLNEQGSSPTTGYNCHYQAPHGSCFMYPSDQWVTFYYAVTIGTFGQPDSTIQAWVSVDGQPYGEWVNMTNHTLDEDSPGADYDMVTLLPYMTERDPSVSAGPTAYTWYDELIVSSQPIAAPTSKPALP